MKNKNLNWIVIRGFLISGIIYSGLNAISSFIVARFYNANFFNDFYVLQGKILIANNILPIGLNAALVIFHGTPHFSIIKRILFNIALPLNSIIFTLILLLDNINAQTSIMPTYGVLLMGLLSYVQTRLLCAVVYFQSIPDFRTSLKLQMFFIATAIVPLFIVYVYQLGILEYLMAACLISLVSNIIISRLAYIVIDNKKINIEATKDILKYSIPAGINASIASLLVVGDRLFLDIFNQYERDTYLKASLSASYILFLISVYSNALGIGVRRNFNSINEAAVRKQNFYSGILSSLKIVFLFPAYIPIMLAMLYSLDIFYIESIIISSILLAAYIVTGVSKYFLAYLNLLKCSFSILISSVISISLFFVFVGYFNKSFGILGLAYLVLLSNSMNLIIQIIFVHHAFK